MASPSPIVAALAAFAIPAAVAFGHPVGEVPPGANTTVPNVAPGEAGLPTPAGRPKLLIGDAAPELSIAKWITEKSAPRFERGTVYVVEFWATWCPPCRRSIPYLTELQQKYAGSVVIIGVTSREPDGVGSVEQFVKQAGDRIGYLVAWDDAGKSDDAWMESAGQEGIPTAFVVDKSGRLAWIGYPMDGLDAVLEQIVADRFDLNAAAARARQEADILAAAAPLKRALDEQLSETRFDDACATIDRIVALDPSVMGEYILMKFTVLAAGAKNLDAAYTHADSAVSGTLKDNPRLLGLMAWMIAEDSSIDRRFLDVAERAAARALELTDRKSAAAFGAMARVRLAQGKPEEAVSLQSQAVELEKSRTIRQEYQSRLEQYQSKVGAGTPPASRK
ncbi:MAG: TlpA family protein disulfide reductase [Phycisphaerales bacterium]